MTINDVFPKAAEQIIHRIARKYAESASECLQVAEAGSNLERDILFFSQDYSLSMLPTAPPQTDRRLQGFTNMRALLFSEPNAPSPNVISFVANWETNPITPRTRLSSCSPNWNATGSCCGKPSLTLQKVASL